MRLAIVSFGFFVVGFQPVMAQELVANGFNSSTNEFLEERGSEESVSISGSFEDNFHGRITSSILAQSDYGINRASSSVFSEGRSSSASAISRWSDSIIISSSGGGSGIVNFRVFPIGSIATDLGSIAPDLSRDITQAGFSYDFVARGGGSRASYNLLNSTILNSLTGSPSLSLEFQFDNDISFTSTLSCFAQAGAGSSASCSAAESVYWDGITSVTDLDGNLITDWTVSSLSGTDYRQSFVPISGAVPEPSTWAMMILGFGLVGGALRSRRRQKVTVSYA